MSGNILRMAPAIKLLFFITISPGLYSEATSGTARITVDFNVSPKPDTLYLLKFPAITYKGFPAEEVFSAIREPSGLYLFEIGVGSEPELYRICRKEENDTTETLFKSFRGSSTEYFELTGDIYFCDGDNVMLAISKNKPEEPLTGRWFFDYKTQISGPGSAMHYVKLKSDSLLFRAYDGKPSFDEKLNYHHSQGSVRKIALSYLDNVRRQVPEPYFYLIRTDIIYHVTYYLFSKLENFYQSYRAGKGSAEAFKSAYESAIARHFTEQLENPDDNSANYIRFIKNKAAFDSFIAEAPEPVAHTADLLASQYSGRVRDRATVMHITSTFLEIPPALYAKAASVVENRECKTLLNLLGARAEGADAYNFELEDADGRLHRLSDMKGKWVYIDFWFTGCSACSYFFENALEEAERHFADDPGIIFVSVSVDKGKTRWINSVKGGKYTSGNALNLYTNGEGWKHQLVLYYAMDSFPSAILIDPDGKIYRYNTPDLLVRNAPDLIATLQAYMANKTTGGRRE